MSSSMVAVAAVQWWLLVEVEALVGHRERRSVAYHRVPATRRPVDMQPRLAAGPTMQVPTGQLVAAVSSSPVGFVGWLALSLPACPYLEGLILDQH